MKKDHLSSTSIFALTLTVAALTIAPSSTKAQDALQSSTVPEIAAKPTPAHPLHQLLAAKVTKVIEEIQQTHFKLSSEILSIQEELDVARKSPIEATDTLDNENITASIDTAPLNVPSLADTELQFAKQPDFSKKPVTAAKVPSVENKPQLAEIKPKGSVLEEPAKDAEIALVAPQTLNRLQENNLPDAVVTALQDLQDLPANTALSAEVRQEIKDFYAAREFKPLWTDENGITTKAQNLIEYIGKADDDGLSASDYVVAGLNDANQGAVKTRTAQELAELEMQIAQVVVHYARDAQGGRLTPRRVSRNFDRSQTFPQTTNVLNQVGNSEDATGELASFHPQHPQFKALREQLVFLLHENDEEEEENIEVPVGKTLTIGAEGIRVALLRQRLNVPITDGEQAESFDNALKSAVRAYQAENGLLADGIVGPRTLAALNGTKPNKIPDLIANMEQWRWMPRELGDVHVFVNIPSYELNIMRNGESTHRTRVVVGKRKHPTPVFSEGMKHVVLNPYWNVPYSIASKELLPNIKRSGGSYLTKRNYELISSRGKVINPGSVNWSKVTAKNMRGVRIRQRPGGRNALGQVKFLFPNKHAVYLHDTQSKSLFNKVARAFSHGCVRVHKPFEFADALLKTESKFSGDTLRRNIGGKERWYNLSRHIPVHISYFTAVVNKDGAVKYKGDIYGYNAKIKRALGLL